MSLEKLNAQSYMMVATKPGPFNAFVKTSRPLTEEMHQALGATSQFQMGANLVTLHNVSIERLKEICALEFVQVVNLSVRVGVHGPQ